MTYYLYEKKTYSSAKHDAQLNLEGRTHYVDDKTLRYFHARITQSGVAFDGLLYWIIESVALDPDNTRRGFRPVMFDIFGNILARVSLEQAYKTSDQAYKALKESLASLDIKTQTLDGLERFKRQAGYVEADVLTWVKESPRLCIP